MMFYQNYGVQKSDVLSKLWYPKMTLFDPPILFSPHSPPPFFPGKHAHGLYSIPKKTLKRTDLYEEFSVVDYVM